MTDKTARDLIERLEKRVFDDRYNYERRLTELEHRVKLLADAMGSEFSRYVTDDAPWPQTQLRKVNP